MKKITFVCAIAMLVAFALPAQAAVQNVKVSGDITLRGFYRDNLDLNTAATDKNEDQFFMSTVGVNIDADLTDNVSAAIRVGSQRDWDVAEIASTDVDIDLAYITLKEMLYSPLTIIVGRQDLWYGDGLIVGANFTNPDPGGVISAHEYTDVTSFDAIRAILDYDPWTIDLLYAKIEETLALINVPDDIDLWGVNVGYVFGEYDAEAEAYLFTKHDSSPSTGEGDYVYTIGVRGSVVPLENLDLRGELAFQCGDYIDPTTLVKRDREAWAVDVSGSYCWADYAWLPTLGVGYMYLSGEEAGNTGDFEAWDVMYTGKFVSALRDFHEWMYTTDQVVADRIATGNPVAMFHGLTNAHKIIVNGSVQPTDNVLLDLTYLHLIFAEEPVAGRDEEIGDEVDLRLTYEYTEDVTFGLLSAWFFPGDYFTAGLDETATEVVGTVSLVF